MATSNQEELAAALAELGAFASQAKKDNPTPRRTIDEIKRSGFENKAVVTQKRELSPREFLEDALAGNAALLPGVFQLADLVSGRASDRTLSEAEKGTQAFQNLTEESAQRAGVDINQLTRALTGVGALTLQDSQRTASAADDLISGRFFDSAIGKENIQNLLRSIAPTLSVGGLNTVQGFAGGSSGNSEVDQVTAFLQNSIAERDRGFSLRNQAITQREAAASRLGGVLTFGTEFGRGNAAQGFNFGGGIANTDTSVVGGNLLTTAAFDQDRSVDLGNASELLNVYLQMEQQSKARSSAKKAGIGSAVGAIAGAVLAPFTGGASLALTAGALGAGAS